MFWFRCPDEACTPLRIASNVAACSAEAGRNSEYHAEASTGVCAFISRRCRTRGGTRLVAVACAHSRRPLGVTAAATDLRCRSRHSRVMIRLRGSRVWPGCTGGQVVVLDEDRHDFTSDWYLATVASAGRSRTSEHACRVVQNSTLVTLASAASAPSPAVRVTSPGMADTAMRSRAGSMASSTTPFDHSARDMSIAACSRPVHTR